MMKNGNNSECCSKSIKCCVIAVAIVVVCLCGMHMKHKMAKKKGFIVYQIGHEVEIKKSNKKHDYNQCLESFGSICKGNCTAEEARSVCSPILKKKHKDAKQAKKSSKDGKSSSKSSKK